nr:asialoglycoprotein receptor 1 isoform X2 [Misgurnus anguillicaudatus]XP_055054129.1 asialoglycoprotein receptor 1 isoform X2 [Misgurnus anguillicaudatus]
MKYKKMEGSEEILPMDMDYKQSQFRKDGPCGRRMDVLVLLGTVAIVISMTMIFVIYCSQERKFSALHSWMESLNSTTIPDHHITGDLVKKFTEVQHSVSSLNLYLNKSSDPVTNGISEKRLSDLEIFMSSLGLTLSSLTSKQDENLKRLEQRQDVNNAEMKNLLLSLNSSLSALTSKLNDAVNNQEQKMAQTQQLLDSLKTSVTNQQNKQCDCDSLSSSLRDVQSSMSNLTSSIVSLSSKQQITEERLISSLNELKAQINTKLSSDKPVSNCKSGWIPYDSSCYLFSRNALNWTNARDYCKEQGASLLKIDGSDGEWAFVRQLAMSSYYWIGLTDQTTGQWRWSDDTPYTMDKKHWDEGQPDDWKEHGLGEEGEDCAAIKPNGLLNDAHCSESVHFICKVKI